MKFSNAKQIIVMMIVWAVALLAIDELKNPRPLKELFGTKTVPAAAHPGKPHLTLYMNHLCCSGCLGDVREALSKLPWLGKVEIATDPIPQEQADKTQIKEDAVAANYGNRIEVDITNIGMVDFVALEKALREVGLVAERIEFGGVRHFRLEAELNHLCCELCKNGVQQGFDLAKNLRGAGANFKWLDSVQVIKEKKKIVAYARYDNVVDIVDYLNALGHIGFAPSSLTVQADPEK